MKVPIDITKKLMSGTFYGAILFEDGKWFTNGVWAVRIAATKQGELLKDPSFVVHVLGASRLDWRQDTLARVIGWGDLVHKAYEDTHWRRSMRPSHETCLFMSSDEDSVAFDSFFVDHFHLFSMHGVNEEKAFVDNAQSPSLVLMPQRMVDFEREIGRIGAILRATRGGM